MITIQNANLSDIKIVTFDGVNEPVFMYNSVPTVLVGVDLNKKSGTYTVAVALSNGNTIKQSVAVQSRTIVQEKLGIPQDLGGNTAAGQANVLSDIAKQKDILNGLKTNKKTLWTKPFIFPLAGTITVTDPYGYSRQTGTVLIAHKGVDLHAASGTPVMAMNRGVVRMVGYSPTYGNTIAIDHGQGIMSFYLHLSTFKVKEGQVVAQGQVIGLSGQTGYAVGPHLHLTVRINGISIDPMKFMALF